jgi:hypothetical protein
VTWKPAYATLAEFRAYLKLPASTEDTEAEDAAIYSPAIEAASRVIDSSCSRQFGFTDDGEEEPEAAVATFSYLPFYLTREAQWCISVDDLFSTDDLEVDGTAYDATVHRFLPLNAPDKGRPYTYLVLLSGSFVASTPVEVTALFGWPAVPDAIKNATLLQASRIVKRRDAPFGVAGSPEMGNEIRLLAKLDPDVAVMVGPYRMYW